MVEAKANFVICTAKRRVIIKKICLEEIVGFSFFETNIEHVCAAGNPKNDLHILEKRSYRGSTINNLFGIPLLLYLGWGNIVVNVMIRT